MDLNRFVASFALAPAIALTACAPPPVSTLPNQTLTGTDGREHPLIDPDAKLTVIELFSVHCKCQTKHDERMKLLVKEFAGRSVRFVAVDSEVGASIERDGPEAEKRAYPYPILLDPHGSVARTFGAEYATFSIVVTSDGQVLYQGGIDSDMHDLSLAPATYLKDAIFDAVNDRPVRRPRARTLGCGLNIE